jgi:ubiquinone/menaquinone biosynthesis C-methylase UbiE
MTLEYHNITERPEDGVPMEQLLRYYQRYCFALQYCQSRDVLEVACGSGGGLGLLAGHASSVTGLDVDEKNVHLATTTYIDEPKVTVVAGDAHDLRFPDNSFDSIILYEAIYYLKDPVRFLTECRRILRPGGHLVLGSANREWIDFNPSAYSTYYFSASELLDLMEGHGFETELYKGCLVQKNRGHGTTILSYAKRLAVKFHLIPKSMKYKKILKRLFVGKLVSLPSRLSEGAVAYIPPVALNLADEDRQFKVIYAVGRAAV